MKTMFFAAAAVASLGVGAAYAGDGSEGLTATARNWRALNGEVHTYAAPPLTASQYGNVQYSGAGQPAPQARNGVNG